MNFLNIVKNRYTTKKYNSKKKISDEKIRELQEILQLSPSSINSQPWKFTFISDEKIKSKLAAASYFNEQKINEASHLVVFSAIDDIEEFEKQIYQNLPEGAIGYYNQFIKINPETEIKSWLQHQVYLSLGFFLSACGIMEIDSSPMEGIKNEEYKSILKLENYKPLFAVAIGYRNPEDVNQPTIKQKERLHSESIINSL